MYYTYIEPTLSSHEQEIEMIFTGAQEKAKTHGMGMLRAMVKNLEQLTMALVSGNKYNAEESYNDENSISNSNPPSDDALLNTVSLYCYCSAAGCNISHENLSTPWRIVISLAREKIRYYSSIHDADFQCLLLLLLFFGLRYSLNRIPLNELLPTFIVSQLTS